MKLFNSKKEFYIITDEYTRFKVDDFIDRYELISVDLNDELARFKFSARKTGIEMWNKICKVFGSEFYVKGKGNTFLIMQKEGVA